AGVDGPEQRRAGLLARLPEAREERGRQPRVVVEQDVAVVALVPELLEREVATARPAEVASGPQHALAADGDVVAAVVDDDGLDGRLAPDVFDHRMGQVVAAVDG